MSLLRSRTRRNLKSSSPTNHARRPFKPLLEALEDRVTPATLTVNTLADDLNSDSLLTLREAMTLVNAGTTNDPGNGLDRALSADELRQVNGDLGTADVIRFESAPGVPLTGLITV